MTSRHMYAHAAYPSHSSRFVDVSLHDVTDREGHTSRGAGPRTNDQEITMQKNTGAAFGLTPQARTFSERLNLGQISPEVVVPSLFGQRFDDGAGGGGNTSGQSSAGSGQAATGQAAGGSGDGDAAAAGQQGQGGDTGENGIEAPVGGVPFADLPKTTQDEVRRLRTRDRERTQTIADLQGKQTPDGATVLTPEARRALGVALGYEQDAAPSGEELASRVSQTQQENAALNRANMVLRVAAGQGANADVLLDSTAFLQTIAGLDPATQRQEFEQKISAWVTSHPYAALQQSQAAGSSGGQHQSSGSGASTVRKGLGAAIDSALKR